MAQKKNPVDVKAMFEELRTSKPKFGKLDASVGLWLLWRRTQHKPVSAPIAAKVIPGVSIHMVEYFFSTRSGIGSIDQKQMSLKAICDLYDVKISESQAAEMIQEAEESYGSSCDEMLKRNRKLPVDG